MATFGVTFLQVYAWVAVFVLPLNAAMNPLLYTLSTGQFVEQAQQRLRTVRLSWKRSFAMKTCTTAVSEARGQSEEHRQLDRWCLYLMPACLGSMSSFLPPVLGLKYSFFA